jgi:hypothetical protein
LNTTCSLTLQKSKEEAMGQRQSSDGGTPQNEGQMKTDYYELLGVERQATNEE